MGVYILHCSSVPQRGCSHLYSFYVSVVPLLIPKCSSLLLSWDNLCFPLGHMDQESLCQTTALCSLHSPGWVGTVCLRFDFSICATKLYVKTKPEDGHTSHWSIVSIADISNCAPITALKGLKVLKITKHQKEITSKARSLFCGAQALAATTWWMITFWISQL